MGPVPGSYLLSEIRPYFLKNKYMHTGIRPIEKRTGTLAFMASAGARAYNGGLGAEPPVGSQWEIYVAHLIRNLYYAGHT